MAPVKAAASISAHVNPRASSQLYNHAYQQQTVLIAAIAPILFLTAEQAHMALA